MQIIMLRESQIHIRAILRIRAASGGAAHPPHAVNAVVTCSGGGSLASLGQRVVVNRSSDGDGVDREVVHDCLLI